jgi:RNA polymerase sigma factor (sigma-70 family)
MAAGVDAIRAGLYRLARRRVRSRSNFGNHPSVSGVTDEELVARALAGERGARRQLAEQLLESIQREVAYCLLRAAAPSGRDPRQEVRDMVQDVLVALFERDARELRRWDPERGRNLDSFVRLVARRRVARILGQRTGNPWADSPVDPDDLDEADDHELVQHLEERQALDRLLVALGGRMSARDHELFEMLFVQELDPDEVATRMEMTRGAVNAWSYRMRKLARAIAAELEPEPSPAGDIPTKEKRHHGG